jgi:hypothetical protein
MHKHYSQASEHEFWLSHLFLRCLQTSQMLPYQNDDYKILGVFTSFISTDGKIRTHVLTKTTYNRHSIMLYCLAVVPSLGIILNTILPCRQNLNFSDEQLVSPFQQLFFTTIHLEMDTNGDETRNWFWMASLPRYWHVWLQFYSISSLHSALHSFFFFEVLSYWKIFAFDQHLRFMCLKTVWKENINVNNSEGHTKIFHFHRCNIWN